MVELLNEAPQRPMIGWECSECGEPYNSRSKPDQHMCASCRRECLWELPDDFEELLCARLRSVSEGDSVCIVPEHAAGFRGRVLNRRNDALAVGDEHDYRLIEAYELVVVREKQGYIDKDDIHYVEKL